MRAELLKLRFLPTPRVLIAVGVVIAFLVALGLAIDAPATGRTYRDSGLAGATTFASIASIAFGVWIVGLEYGQGTMRRVVAATPARSSILAAKLALLLACIMLGTIGICALGWAMAAVAGLIDGVHIPLHRVGIEVAAALVGNVAYAIVAFTVALLTRSMAGGITITLVLALVVDTLLGAIPVVGDYTFGASIGDVAGTIRGDRAAEMWGRGLAVTVGWLLALSAASWLRFCRQDVK
jgi:ABC-2 type transport system permease protein